MTRSSTKNILLGSGMYGAMVMTFTVVGFAILGFLGVLKFNIDNSDGKS